MSPVKVSIAYDIEGRKEILPIYQVFPGQSCLTDDLSVYPAQTFSIICNENDDGARIKKAPFIDLSSDEKTNLMTTRRKFLSDFIEYDTIGPNETININNVKNRVSSKIGDLIISHYQI